MQDQKQHRLFVVDDDAFTGMLYKQFLTTLGYTDIHYFASGVDCLDNLHLDPDVILLDHDMAQVTGYEVLKKIKRYDPDMAVIMVSGQEDIATAVNALKYGAFDYIIKDRTETTRIADALERLSRLQAMTSRSRGSVLKKLLSRV